MAVAPPVKVRTSAFARVALLLLSLIKPLAGIAVPAAKGATPSAVNIPRNSPTLLPPLVTSGVPCVPKLGTFPEDAENGTHQTSVPSILNSPSFTSTSPTTAEFCPQRTSEFIVRTAPLLMVILSPFSSARFAESSKLLLVVTVIFGIKD